MNFNYDRSGLELKKYGELHGIVQTNRLRTSKKFGPVEKENTRGGRHQGWPSRTEIDVILGDRHLTASTAGVWVQETDNSTVIVTATLGRSR